MTHYTLSTCYIEPCADIDIKKNTSYVFYDHVVESQPFVVYLVIEKKHFCMF